MKIDLEKVYGPCQIGKQIIMSHKMVKHPSTTRVLELLHMDLIGPRQFESIGGKMYVFVCADDYSRFSWVSYLREKSNTFIVIKIFFLKLIHEKNIQLKKAIKIRSDRGKEFENSLFIKLCNKHVIDHEFSTPKTP